MVESTEYMPELEAALKEKSYTRHIVPQADLECLPPIPRNLFERKDKQIGKNPEVECLSEIVDEMAAVIGRTYVEKGTIHNLQMMKL